MNDHAARFEAYYATLNEGDLTRLAESYDDLTDAAQSAMRAEFSRRNLEPPLAREEGPEADFRDLVTVERYRDVPEAVVGRSALEAAGISAFLQDENLCRMAWQYSNFIGGMRLQVDRADAAAAQEFLNQPRPSSIEQEGHDIFHQPVCPGCGSSKVATFPASLGGWPSYDPLQMPALLSQTEDTWQCEACGTIWVATDAPSRR